MRKKQVLLTVAIAWLLILLSACSTAQPLADSFVADDVMARAKSVVDLINTLDYEAMTAEIREDLQSQLSADQIKKAWDARLSSIGSFKEYKSIIMTGTKSKSTGEDYATVILICTYEKGTATYTLSFGTDLQLVGLYMR